MKILILSTNDFSGAGKAAEKLNKCLNSINIESQHRVLIKYSNIKNKNNFKNNIHKLKGKTNSIIGKINGKNIKEFQSLSIFPTNLHKEINKSDFDIVNLTWINEYLSIEDIGKIEKPIVWTLCDMWPIGGVNHYDEYSENAFWRKENFGKNNSISLLDKWIIKRKIKYWKNRNLNFIAPSQWIYDCARGSAISQDFQIRKIPWPIDRKLFKPMDKIELRKKFNLPINKKIILFNSFSGIYSKRKGWDIFFEILKKYNNNFDVLIIGNGSNENINSQIKNKLHWFGKIDNDLKLAELINCADAMVLPSRMDNLPQTGLEAQSCGLPIVTFNANGLKDLVDHKDNGFLAKPFEIDSFYEGIKWVLEFNENSKLLSENSLKKSKKLWDNSVVGSQYANFYNYIIS